MDFKDYQNKATISANKDLSQKEALAIAALGLAGESGEVADILKKHLGHNHPLNTDELKKELGDILWYIAWLSDLLDIDMEDIATTNIEKLKKRYPNGFSSADSINRKD